jgi:hypothetical protein
MHKYWLTRNEYLIFSFETYLEKVAFSKQDYISELQLLRKDRRLLNERIK